MTSHGVMPVGLPVSPALFMKATTASASAEAFTVERWSLAMSTPLAQLLAWIASSAFGAYLSRSLRKAHAMPRTVLGSVMRSALPVLATAAASVVGSALWC